MTDYKFNLSNVWMPISEQPPMHIFSDNSVGLEFSLLFDRSIS